MRTLELCCGTKSFSKHAQELGHSTLTVDCNYHENPDLCVDVRTLFFGKGSFDFVWCSPPCQHYSKAKTVGVRNFQHYDSIVAACIRIIKEIQPTYWCIENPQGLLATRPIMEELKNNLSTVDYCMYGFPYRKTTHLWNNFNFEGQRCKYDCGATIPGTKRHMQHAQKGNKCTWTGTKSIDQRHSLPPKLMAELFDQAVGHQSDSVE